MLNDKLDIKSPYIKETGENLSDVRRRIAKRAGGYAGENDNLISLSNRSREESDNLLELKIQKASKRIVGEEIRKFAEIASMEIEGELNNLEKSVSKKIENLEERLQNSILLQNENQYLSEETIERKINTKLVEINNILDQMENRIKDLEVYSLAENKFENTIQEKKEAEVKEEYSLNLSRKDVEIDDTKYEKEEIKKIEPEEKIEECKEEAVIVEEVKEMVIAEEESKDLDEDKKEYKERYKDESEYDKKEKYVAENIKKIVDRFEKNGFLFKKNIYLSSLEKLNAEDFLRDKKDIEGVDEKEKEKMLDILENLIGEVGTEPKKDETIKHFLKRIYREKYENKN